MEWADVAISLRAGAAVLGEGDLAPDRVAARRAALGRVSATRTAGTRWVLVRLPTAGLARRAGLRPEALVDAFFAASLRDWGQEGRRDRAAAARFAGGREVRVRGRDTDLRFSIAGRSWLIDDGHINLPGGEIATSPEEASAEGEIRFEGPAVFAGHELTGVHLRFAAGRVVEASADRNAGLLRELLGIDDGARRIGEIGFGTNPGLRDLCGDLLYDEKVPGTFHLALGRSYAACGGRNPSALHWDIVKDLREEGTVTLDGRVVFEGGRLLLD
jgi:aminopeptidase